MSREENDSVDRIAAVGGLVSVVAFFSGHGRGDGGGTGRRRVYRLAVGPSAISGQGVARRGGGVAAGAAAHCARLLSSGPIGPAITYRTGMGSDLRVSADIHAAGRGNRGGDPCIAIDGKI